MPKKKGNARNFRGGMAEAVATVDEEDDVHTTTGPDGRQIPVAHATPVRSADEHGGGGGMSDDGMLLGPGGLDPSLLLVGLSDHDDERGRLAMSLQQVFLH